MRHRIFIGHLLPFTFYSRDRIRAVYSQLLLLQTLRNHRFFIDADGFQAYMDMPKQIIKIQDWIKIARNVTGKHSAARAATKVN